MCNSPYRYRVFGLNVDSQYELPELRVAPADEPADVVVTAGRVASGGEPFGSPHPISGGTLFEIDGVARYAVTGGCSIVVDAEHRTPARNVRLYLLGSALGLLLHQRGLLPLHASVIELAGQACAFLGHSGSGKSTLAAACFDRGHRVIADDVCVVRFDEAGGARVSPGIPRLRLWEDALAMTGRDPSAYPLAYAGTDQWNKFDVTLTAEAAEDVPLAAIYLLANGDRFSLDRLSTMTAVEAIIANTYRGEYVPLSGHARAHWEACLRLAAAGPVIRCARTFERSNFENEVELLLGQARTLVRERSGGA